MAFENGSATSMADLLSKLRTFISTNLAWTENNFDGTNLQVSNGNSYFNLRATTTLSTDTSLTNGGPGIGGVPSTGYDAGAAWDEQPGAAVNRQYVALGTFAENSVPEYWFFTDDSSYVHVVAFSGIGTVYTHLSFGDVTKFGTFTGGTYMASGSIFDNGSAESRIFGNAFGGAFIVRADIDSTTNFWYGSQNPDNEAGQGAGEGRSVLGIMNDLDTFYAALLTRGNAHDGKGVLLPVWVAVERTFSDRYSPLGLFKDVKALNLGKAIPGTSMVLGSDEWVLFPSNSQAHISDYGIAYKKIP